MKKYLPSFLVFISLLAPTLALATSPVIDPATTAETGADTATNTVTTSQQVLKTIKDYGLDQVAYTIAQKLGQKMASAAINKATGGASKDNDPNFVKDFGAILTNIEQQQRDLFTTNLLLSSNPYARGIAKDFMSGSANPLNNFTLGSILSSGGDWQEVGNNISLAGKDSLLFYSQLALPQNTPIGARALAQDALSKQVSNKQASESLKISSSGFLPQTKCNAKISDYKNNVNALIGSSEEQTFDTPEQANAYNAYIAEQQNSTIGHLTEDTAGCIEEMIKNPIATTQTLTNEAGKFGMDMTKNISGWGQIVAGLFVSLFNGFVEKGLSTLNADYGAVKASNVGGPEQLAAAANAVTNNFANVPVNIVDLRKDLEDSLVKTEENIDTIKKVQETLLEFPARLAILDMMLPGPDLIGLDNRLDKYYDHQTAWLQKNSMIGSDDNRNAYEEHVLSFLEREYEISRNEMTRDMNDDTRNIPGAGVMRIAIGTFKSRKQALQAANTNLDDSSNALSALRQINVGIKKNIDWLRINDATDFASLPTIVFTKREWAAMTGLQQDETYAWAKTHAQDPHPPTNPNDAQKMDLAIKTSWDLWENPETFTTAGNWIDENQGAAFLVEKNKIRAQFSSIGDIIPSDWETNKNVEDLQAYTTDIANIDNLITDANQMRHLFWGDGATENSWFTQNPGKMPADLLAYMITNKDTLFKSADLKSSLTLPNILNSPRSAADDGCLPDGPHNQYPYQANNPSSITGADRTYGACAGNFGYTLSGLTYGGHHFDEWIDASSNQYQSSPHVGWPPELYWRATILKAVPPPIPDVYNSGWTVQPLRNPDGFMSTPDGGQARGIFCRLGSVSAVYGRFSGYALDHNGKNMYCSSKWYDVSPAEAVGLFIVNQLR